MTPEEYDHTIKPFNHQVKHLLDNMMKKAWGLLWEQGTAKTKPIIDTTCIMYLNQEINALLVVAPPGVERNWASDEIPKHIDSDVAMETMIAVFKTNKKHTQEHKRKLAALLGYDGLAILLISYNAFMTKEGKEFVWKFLKKRKCLYVLDESHNIKSPGAKRTISIVASGKYAEYRRILTGTPISIGPFDLYSQIKFLDAWFWKNKGIHGAAEFRQHFGEWFTRGEHQILHGYDPGYDQLLSYKNLDQLTMWLAEITDRVLKEDVLDLPPKLYSKRYFDLGPKQMAAYNQLKEEMYLEIGDQIITAELPIVRLIRFQQIACNYIPVSEDEPAHMFSEKNPRMAPMEDIRDSVGHQTIVWAKFRHDIDQLMDLLGKDAVRYDGAVDEDQSEKNKLAFQSGDKQFFVGNAQKGGSGLTLTCAKTMVYYSNGNRLIDRLQSEDRFHRGGMDEFPVNIIDIIAGNVNVDENTVNALRGHKEIAAEIQGDRWREWI